MKQTNRLLSLFLCILANTINAESSNLSAHDPHQTHHHVVVQLGGYSSTAGLSQDIPIEDLVGNQYTLAQHHHKNGLIGLGYYMDGPENTFVQMNYGVNGFYLAHTPVNGHIVVEHFFEDLSYRYQIQHVPVYLAAKAFIKNESKPYQLTLDAGFGINFVHTFNYKETSLNSDALSQDNFAPNKQEMFTATAGIGLRFNHVFGQAPLECGYRFFYLGQGHLKIKNDLYQNSLKSGNNYANALLCSVTV